MTDHYLVNHQTWDVSDEAEQCTACETMSFIFVRTKESKSCIGCADYIERNMNDETTHSIPSQ